MKSILISLSLLIIMVSFVLFMFKSSEPTYINNSNSNNVVKYDFVSVDISGFRYGKSENKIVGLVLQTDKNILTDSSYALVKYDGLWSDEYVEINTSRVEKNYRVIGRGTFYHKINNLIGWNLMAMTNIICVGVTLILLIVFLKSINDLTH